MWSWSLSGGTSGHLRSFCCGLRVVLCSPLETNAKDYEERHPPFGQKGSKTESLVKDLAQKQELGTLEIARAYPEVWISYGVTAALLAVTVLYLRRRLSAAERLLHTKQPEGLHSAEHTGEHMERVANRSSSRTSGLDMFSSSVEKRDAEQAQSSHVSEQPRVSATRSRRGRPPKRSSTIKVEEKAPA
ncbi:hypothetical protein CCYA_CCYA13G3636 [Cyanidiococcus yangmingshanensis]|nr:hypothetical protein CCYA_CCYA13G3636 [Cyanidiococcus yangmingshanensis]